MVLGDQRMQAQEVRAIPAPVATITTGRVGPNIVAQEDQCIGGPEGQPTMVLEVRRTMAPAGRVMTVREGRAILAPAGTERIVPAFVVEIGNWWNWRIGVSCWNWCQMLKS